MKTRTQQVSLQVEGMGCAGCATKIETLLRRVSGVREAAVSYPQREAVIAYDPEVTAPEALATVLTEAGYLVPSGGLAGTPQG